jgi:Bacterial Ig-like domain (group 3)
VSTRWVLVLGTVAAAVVLIASAGAGTQPAPSGTVYLNTKTGVIKYLISHGIDPKGVVIQRGSHNYAGPSCPGRGWHCTTAKRVVQLSMAPNNPTNPSANQFTCTDAPPPSNSSTPYDCLIVQSATGTDNDATCTEKIGDATATQNCDVYQLNTTGANNVYVQQSIAQSAVDTLTTPGTSAQSATQATEVGQWNGSGSNSVFVNQDIKESQSASLGKTDSVTQQQDGHQSAAVSQHSDFGNNTAKVLQSLQLKASATGGTSITQRQDTTGGGPNSNAAIYQNSDQDTGPINSSGTNNAYVFQSNDLNASGAKTGTLTQQQGAYSTGINAYVDQRSTGLSTTQANQNEHQSLGASQVSGTLLQTQIGPLWFDPNQASNTADTFTASQSSDQNAGPTSEQDDQEYAECGSSGICSLTQKVANDKQNATNSCVDSSCDISLTAIGGSEPFVNVCTEDCGFEAPAPPPDPLSEGGNFCENISGGPCSPPVLTTTSTGITQDVSCSSSGFPTTFTATVTPSPGATGSVDFKEGASVLATVPLSTYGTAIYTTSLLPVGTHTITAVYSGGGSYAGSTTPTGVTHQVASGSCIL